MAIILPSGFEILNNEPVDARFSLADQTARYGLSSANIYEGLVVYQRDNNTLWILVDTSQVSGPGGWQQITSSELSDTITDRLDSLEGVSGSYATTGSNLFVGNQNINGSVTSSKVLTDAVRFNTSAGVSVGVGELAWNNSDGTLDLGMKGGAVVQQIGQEIFYEVRNETGIQIPNGTAVFANGVTAGSARITASPYTADGSVREVRFLGLATENISTGVNGIVTHFGYVRGLDTRGDVVSSIAVGDETWAVGDVLYVHPTVAGKLTNVAPKHEISVAIVIVRHQSVGVLFVRPTSYGHLDDIHDVQITTGSLVTGSMLEWNGEYFVNNDTFSSSVDNRLDLLESNSSSLQDIFEEKASSTHTLVSGSSQLTSSYDNRYVTLEGDQTIGSTKTFNNIVVNGTGSFAFIQSTTGSSTSIGEAFIILNENTPSSNFAGIKIVDSGSAFTTASFIYDGLNNNWVFQHEGSVDSGSSLAIFGPLSQGGLGTEVGLTENRIPKSVTNHGHHIGDSNITDSGTLITLGSNTQLNGGLNLTGGISGLNVISGSSQIDATATTNWTTGIKTQLNTNTVVSGSSQVIGILSSLNTYTSSNDTTNTTQNSRLDQLSTASGSAISRLNILEVETANLETFSSSTLTRLTALEVETANLESFTSSINTTIKTRLNAETVVSGSSQVIGILSSLNSYTASNDTTNTTQNSRLDQLSTASGSAITRLNALEVETANLETFSSSTLTRLTALEVETANLETFTSSINTTIKTRLNAETVVSGSSQINVSSTTGDIALGTRTSGNYVAVISGSANQITVAGSGLESAVVTLSLPQNIHTSANPQFNSLGIGTTASTTAGEIRATGDITAFYSSDIRLKENIQPIQNALEKVESISGNTYDWKEGYDEIHSHKGKDVGVIAQEIEQILPQIVTNRDNGYKAVQYEKIIPLLIEAIKELSARINSLENK